MIPVHKDLTTPSQLAERSWNGFNSMKSHTMGMACRPNAACTLVEPLSPPTYQRDWVELDCASFPSASPRTGAMVVAYASSPPSARTLSATSAIASANASNITSWRSVNWSP